MRIIPGDHPGLPEYLESIHQRQSSCEKSRLDQQGPGNVPEALELSRSVYPGCFIKAVWYPQKAGKPQDHIIAQVFPDINRHQHSESCRTVHVIRPLYMEIF